LKNPLVASNTQLDKAIAKGVKKWV